jgi:hypothetical protein
MGIRITEYPNTQTTFNNLDEFDVSAYIAPTNYQTRKFTWANLLTQISSVITGLPNGTQGYTLAYNSGAWTSNNRIFVDFTNSLIIFNNNTDFKGTAGNYSGEVAKFGNLRIKNQQLWFNSQFTAQGYTNGFQVVRWNNISPETQDCYVAVTVNGVPIRLHGTIEG